MIDINKVLNSWLKELDQFTFPKYHDFPEIDLYMDQVVTYLERQLNVFSTSSLDKQITSSMINNYVKGEVISAPIQKKYNKEHLSLIEEICTLKQVLSIAEIKQILDEQYKTGNKDEIFNNYKNLFENKISDAVSECNEVLSNVDNNDISSLTNIAMNFAITANAYITISKRILFLTKILAQSQTEELEKEKKNKKIEEEFEEKIKKEKK